MMKQVEIYTDGACSGNPGPGGYGIILTYKRHKKEISGGYARTTNNRMELLGAIVALETLTESCNVTLYSDSRYLVDAVTKNWLWSWKHRNWRCFKNWTKIRMPGSFVICAWSEPLWNASPGRSAPSCTLSISQSMRFRISFPRMP